MQGHIKLLCVVPKFRNQNILTPCIEIFEFKFIQFMQNLYGCCAKI